MATNKPAIEPIWGSASALKTDPGTVKTNAGWIVEKPPVEWMNWLQNRFNEYLAHVNERGIPQWDTNTTYLIKALTYGSNGIKYEAVQENDGNDPTTDDGTYWVLFGGGMLIPTKVGGYISNDGVLTVGNLESLEINYTGASIDANIGVVTDIDDPSGSGGWTDLIDISGGKYSFQFGQLSGGIGSLLAIALIGIDTAETVGDSLRIQALIDGNIVFDSKIVNTGTGDSYGYWKSYPYPGTKHLFGCNNSLLIRAARVGNFTNVTSAVRVSPLIYLDVL